MRPSSASSDLTLMVTSLFTTSCEGNVNLISCFAIPELFRGYLDDLGMPHVRSDLAEF